MSDRKTDFDNKPLLGTTVLNTRPPHQADELNNAIHELGGNAISFPTIEIAPPTDPSILQDALKNLRNFDIAIFVSANAVDACFSLQNNWPTSLAILCIGTGTASALQKYGKTADFIPTEYNSEGLLQLPILQNIQNKHIGIFCGENPRPLLFAELKQRGAYVQQIICYRRRNPFSEGCLTLLEIELKINELKQNKIDFIITTSPEILSNLYDIFHARHLAWLQTIPIIVISEKMSIMVEQYKLLQPAIIAKNATTEAIIACLCQ